MEFWEKVGRNVGPVRTADEVEASFVPAGRQSADQRVGQAALEVTR